MFLDLITFITQSSIFSSAVSTIVDILFCWHHSASSTSEGIPALIPPTTINELALHPTLCVYRTPPDRILLARRFQILQSCFLELHMAIPIGHQCEVYVCETHVAGTPNFRRPGSIDSVPFYRTLTKLVPLMKYVLRNSSTPAR